MLRTIIGFDISCYDLVGLKDNTMEVCALKIEFKDYLRKRDLLGKKFECDIDGCLFSHPDIQEAESYVKNNLIPLTVSAFGLSGEEKLVEFEINWLLS